MLLFFYSYIHISEHSPNFSFSSFIFICFNVCLFNAYIFQNIHIFFSLIFVSFDVCLFIFVLFFTCMKIYDHYFSHFLHREEMNQWKWRCLLRLINISVIISYLSPRHLITFIHSRSQEKIIATSCATNWIQANQYTIILTDFHAVHFIICIFHNTFRHVSPTPLFRYMCLRSWWHVTLLIT